MKTGFNWELGPFELFDAAGVRETTEKMRAAGAPIAANVERLLAYPHALSEPGPTWYKDDPTTPSGRQYFDPVEGVYKPVPVAAGVTSFQILKKAHGVVKRNPGASIVDLGEGVAGCWPPPWPTLPQDRPNRYGQSAFLTPNEQGRNSLFM